MKLFGPLLREAREAREWSIDYVSFKSKIAASVIMDLEADHYADIPSAAYLRSYLKKYSEFLDVDLGVDLDQLMLVTDESATYIPPDKIRENLESSQFSQKNRRYRRMDTRKGSPVFLMAATLVFAGALGIFYYLGSRAAAPIEGPNQIAQTFDSSETLTNSSIPVTLPSPPVGTVETTVSGTQTPRVKLDPLPE